MRIVVLGGSGAWPTAGQACSGYLVEHDGFRLLVDPGYAILPVLLAETTADAVDAALVSHGHPDHCADLSPLLRARALGGAAALPLEIYAPEGAVEPVIALDRPGAYDTAFALHHLPPDRRLSIGPFDIDTFSLPHFVPNLGFRLAADGRTLAYTGDTGPSTTLLDLARDTDLFIAEGTYPFEVPEQSAPYLSSARQAGEVASRAGVSRLLITHLWPGTDPGEAETAARERYSGALEVARTGLTVEL